MKIYKNAFTMIELVLVIVVAGILAAVAIPRIERNSLLEAADQLVGHIRYTQHLAMNDHRFNINDANGWHKTYWRIQFNNANVGSARGWRYTVFNDSAGQHTGNPNSIAEIAIDPQNPNRVLTSGFADQAANNNGAKMNKKLNLQNTYNVINIIFTGGCAQNQTISFDEKGRPMGPLQNSVVPYDRLMRTECNITLSNSAGQTAIINIQPETGYTRITQKPQT